MSHLTLNPNTRLTDALERELLRGALNTNHSTRPNTMLKNTYSTIAKAARGFINYVAAVDGAMQRARVASTHYTGSQW